MYLDLSSAIPLALILWLLFCFSSLLLPEMLFFDSLSLLCCSIPRVARAPGSYLQGDEGLKSDSIYSACLSFTNEFYAVPHLRCEEERQGLLQASSPLTPAPAVWFVAPAWAVSPLRAMVRSTNCSWEPLSFQTTPLGSRAQHDQGLTLISTHPP